MQYEEIGFVLVHLHMGLDMTLNSWEINQLFNQYW